MGILSVFVDAREPEWVKALTFEGAPTTVMMLDAGDVLALCDDGASLAIERKTASDFLNTLRDERLFPQLDGLRRVSQWAYLVICGNLQPGPAGKCLVDGRESGWNWSSVQGALATVQEIGVVVVQVATDYDFEASVVRICKRERGPVRIYPPRNTVALSDGEAVLMSLPGIGPDKAQEIMRFCGRAAWALSYLTDLTWKTPVGMDGIGDGTRRRVRKALGLNEEYDDYALAVLPMESVEKVVKTA